MNWWHLLAGGGVLVFLRHIGFAIGFATQVIAEGFADGLAARRAIGKDAAGITPKMVVDELTKEVKEIRSTK